MHDPRTDGLLEGGQEVVMTKRTKVAAWTAAALSMVVAQPAAPRNDTDPLKITAWAVNMSNIGTGATAQVEFTFERWSTAEERERVITTMLERGQDALLEELQRMPSHGRMRFPTWEGPDPLGAQLGWDLRYTSQESLPDGGRRIMALTDRPIAIGEALNRPRSIDYPFTLIEIHVDRQGVGEGKLSVATKISFDQKKNMIELENYATEPVRLQKVRVEGER
jgi:hypothetical protein